MTSVSVKLRQSVIDSPEYIGHNAQKIKTVQETQEIICLTHSIEQVGQRDLFLAATYFWTLFKHLLLDSALRGSLITG